MPLNSDLSQSEGSFPFRRLPSELRIRIYTLCLASDATYEVNKQTAAKVGVACKAILLTSKAVYDECALVLYANCTFCCTIEDGSQKFRQFINAIGAANAFAIRKFWTRSTFDCMRHKATVRDVFTILFARCPSIRTLHIEALPAPAAANLIAPHGHNGGAFATLTTAVNNVSVNVTNCTRAHLLEYITHLICWMVDEYGRPSCTFVGSHDPGQVQIAMVKIRAAVTWHERRKELEKQLAEGTVDFGYWVREFNRGHRIFMQSTLL